MCIAVHLLTYLLTYLRTYLLLASGLVSNGNIQLRFKLHNLSWNCFAVIGPFYKVLIFVVSGSGIDHNKVINKVADDKLKVTVYVHN